MPAPASPAPPPPPEPAPAAWRRVSAGVLVVGLALVIVGSHLAPVNQGFGYLLWGSWHDAPELAPEPVFNQRLEQLLRPVLAAHFPRGPGNVYLLVSGFSATSPGDQASVAATYFKATQLWLPARVYTGAAGARLNNGEAIIRAQATGPSREYLEQQHLQGVLRLQKQPDGQVTVQYQPLEGTR